MSPVEFAAFYAYLDRVYPQWRGLKDWIGESAYAIRYNAFKAGLEAAKNG